MVLKQEEILCCCLCHCHVLVGSVLCLKLEGHMGSLGSIGIPILLAQPTLCCWIEFAFFQHILWTKMMHRI